MATVRFRPVLPGRGVTAKLSVAGIPLLLRRSGLAEEEAFMLASLDVSSWPASRPSLNKYEGVMAGIDPDEQAGNLATQSLAVGEPTRWSNARVAANQPSNEYISNCRLSPITRSKSSPTVSKTGSATGLTCFTT